MCPDELSCLQAISSGTSTTSSYVSQLPVPFSSGVSFDMALGMLIGLVFVAGLASGLR